MNMWEEGIEPVYGVANIDDDDNNGSQDWADNLIPEEDDLSTLVIPGKLFNKVKNSHSVKLQQNEDGARIYLDGELKTNSADDYFTLDITKDDIVLEIKES